MTGDAPAPRRGRPADRRAARRRSTPSPTSSTAASCSACCRWATRSSPSSSARAAPTRRSTRPAPARRRRCRWPRTGSAPAAAAGSSWSRPTTPPATRCCRGSPPASSPAARPPPTSTVEDAATPFDRRRHGMIVGMGAAAFVVESADAARERGLQPICEVLGAVTANSAFHGTRLDVEHIAGVMEAVVSEAERAACDRDDDRAADGLRLARDLHAGPRRQRRGRDQRPAHRSSAPPPTTS